MGRPGHSCGCGDKGVVRDRAEVIQRAGHLESTSHERVTSSLWRRPLPPLLAAPATFSSQLSLCPVSISTLLGPRPPSLRSDPACPATPSGPDTPRGSTLRTLVSCRSLVTSTAPDTWGADTQHLFLFFLAEYMNIRIKLIQRPCSPRPPHRPSPWPRAPGPWYLVEAAVVTPTGSARTRWSHSSAVARTGGSAGPGW